MKLDTRLEEVDVDCESDLVILYDLLKERTPEQSISHKEMPTWWQHVDFVKSNPYREWYLIVTEAYVAGSVYLTKQQEIGVFIFNAFQGKGHGVQAVQMMLEKHKRILANVNPNNEQSRKLWEKLGGKLIQVTYEVRR